MHVTSYFAMHSEFKKFNQLGKPGMERSSENLRDWLAVIINDHSLASYRVS